jgi:hypothetical protein
MKSIFFILGLELLPSASALSQQHHEILQSIAVGVSPFYSNSENDRVRDSILRFVLEAAPRQGAVSIYDAYNLQSVARFEHCSLPRDYDSAATRIRLFRAQIAQLVIWFNHRTNAPAELAGSAAVLAPEWLEQLSREPALERRTFVLIGSPLRVDVREPGFSMGSDLYPNDAHLVASPEQTVYSTVGKKQRLAHVTVHWIYPSEAIWANELHSQRVRRFWCLFMGLQEGTLANFTSDINGAFRAVANKCATPVGSFSLDPEEKKLEMRLALPREIPVWMPAAPPGSVPVSPTISSVQAIGAGSQQRLSQNQQPSQRAAVNFPIAAPADSSLGIGLMWRQPCDLDLYVRPAPGQPELWFRNTVSPEGYYHHDYQSGNLRGQPSRFDYEYTELNKGPVDIRQVQAWVNYYQGTTTTPTGVVVVWYQGKQFTADFSIGASNGNHGADSAHRAGSPYWAKLDLTKIIGEAP